MRHEFALSVNIVGYFLGSQKFTEPQGKDGGYREDIDWLRAIAVLPVVAFHFEIPGIWGGYVGVDIFRHFGISDHRDSPLGDGVGKLHASRVL
jgi:hypothetical protein